MKNQEEDVPKIVNIDDQTDPELTGEDEDGGRYKRLGREAGGTGLGCTLEEIPPGGRPAKYHYHLANEEALYVIDGKGTLRSPGGDKRIESGDYVAFPAGETGAHAVENTSDDLLRCLFFSTMRDPDVTVYPDEQELHVGTINRTLPFDDTPMEPDDADAADSSS